MLRPIISKRKYQLPISTISKFLQVAAERKDVISLGAGEPDMLPSPEILAAARKSVSFSHYSPSAGTHDLKEAIVRKLRRVNKITAGPENVIVTTGSTEGILLSMLTLIDPGEGVLYPDPGFLAYKPCIEILSGLPLHYHLSPPRFEPEQGSLKEAIISEKTKMLIINTPSNPTGAVYSKKCLEEIVDFAVENDLMILSDEAYESYVYEGRHISIGSLNGIQDRVITLFSASKSYFLPGYRIGYAVGRPDIIQAMSKLHIFTTISAPTISQHVLQAALNQKSSRYYSKALEIYRKRRDFVYKELSKNPCMSIEKPAGTFYMFPSIAGFKKNSLDFSQSLLEKAKVAVIPGIEFGQHGEGHIRISYSCPNEKLKKAMEKISAVCKKH